METIRVHCLDWSIRDGHTDSIFGEMRRYLNMTRPKSVKLVGHASEYQILVFYLRELVSKESVQAAIYVIELLRRRDYKTIVVSKPPSESDDVRQTDILQLCETLGYIYRMVGTNESVEDIVELIINLSK